MFFKLFLAVCLIMFGVAWIINAGNERHKVKNLTDAIVYAIAYLIVFVLACFMITSGIMTFLKLLK